MGLSDKDKKPQGMGLADKKKQSGGRPANVRPRPQQSNAQRGSTNNQKAMNDVAKGAEQTAQGAAQTSRGAAKMSQGDYVGGIKDTAKGANQTAKGVKQMNKGAGNLQDNMKKNPVGKNGKNENNPNPRTAPQSNDPYNADNYESLFPDGDGTNDSMVDDALGAKAMNDNSNGNNDQSDNDSNDNKDDKDKSSDTDDDSGNGIKGLMDDDSDSDDDNADAPSQDDDGEDINMKDLMRKAELAGATGAAASGAAALQALRLFLQWLQAMASQVMAAAASLWASVVATAQAVVSAVATFTGLSMIASAVVTSATVVVTVATVAVGVISNVSDLNDQRMSDSLVCNPTTEVAPAVMEWADSGNSSLQKQDAIMKAWSFFSEMGVGPEVAAGILGNFSAESGVDPTGVETIYSEPYQIGPKKAAAQAAGFRVEAIDAAYGRRFPAVELVGLGLGQWSNTRNTQLLDYADARGLPWYDIGTQLAFMFEADSGKGTLMSIVNDEGITIREAATRFLDEWEIPNAKERNRTYEARMNEAGRIAIEIQSMEVDVEYAQSIISQMNVETAVANSQRSAFLESDDCGDTVASHYNYAIDGTGVMPDVFGAMWSPTTLPNALKAFVYNPEDIGMTYGGQSGWIVNNNPGQCVAFADSYMENLYGVSRPGGVNGGDVAGAWAKKYGATLGGQLTTIPSAGAIFSYMNPGKYGHTGMVQHVFANGDILIAEQNINGLSGDNNGTPFTWSWRYIPADTYKNDDNRTWDWVFYKPDRPVEWVKK